MFILLDNWGTTLIA